MNDPTATRPTDAQIAHVAHMLGGFESVTAFLRALATVVSVDRGDPEGGHLLAKGMRIAVIAQDYVASDRTANGVCIYCHFWPCVCPSKGSRFRETLRRIGGPKALPRVLEERALMIR